MNGREPRTNFGRMCMRVLKDFIQFCALTLKRNFAKFEVRNDFETC